MSVNLTKRQHAEPAVTAVRVISDFILALNKLHYVESCYPAEINAARALFEPYARELQVILGARDPQETPKP